MPQSVIGQLSPCFFPLLPAQCATKVYTADANPRLRALLLLWMPALPVLDSCLPGESCFCFKPLACFVSQIVWFLSWNIGICLFYHSRSEDTYVQYTVQLLSRYAWRRTTCVRALERPDAPTPLSGPLPLHGYSSSWRQQTPVIPTCVPVPLPKPGGHAPSARRRDCVTQQTIVQAADTLEVFWSLEASGACR